MPHIRAILPENERIEAALATCVADIRYVVATGLGYKPKEIAVIPEVIRGKDLKMCDNPLPLEFVIDAGSRVDSEHLQDYADGIVAYIKRMNSFGWFHFGVCLRTPHGQVFAEHEPE